jgi:hypothetical protein
MSKLVWIALLGVALAGCASDNPGRTSSAGGSSATTAPPNTNEDMRGSNNTAPGAEGDRLPPRGSSSGSSAPRSTY